MASFKWKEVSRKLDKINELILKTKADLKERPDNIIVIYGLCFLLIDWLSFGKGGGGGGGESFKVDVQGQGGGRILDVAGKGGLGS